MQASALQDHTCRLFSGIEMDLELLRCVVPDVVSAKWKFGRRRPDSWYKSSAIPEHTVPQANAITNVASLL